MINAACLAGSRLRGKAFGLRYSMPSRLTSLMIAERVSLRPQVLAIHSPTAVVVRGSVSATDFFSFLRQRRHFAPPPFVAELGQPLHLFRDTVHANNGSCRRPCTALAQLSRNSTGHQAAAARSPAASPGFPLSHPAPTRCVPFLLRRQENRSESCPHKNPRRNLRQALFRSAMESGYIITRVMG